jgi:asparagine synthase (glutamine-hydrolysing)
VYNGEIYNFPELRDDLESKGHRFYTKTDTEVIVHAYEEYGDSCVTAFNGMFAFALWDANKKQLFLARDRSGIKPLYYTLTEDGIFLFASEIKSILQYEKIKREVDLQSFHYFVNLRYLPREATMFKGIKKLLPAHIMKVSNRGIKTTEYWSCKIQPTHETEDYYINRLERLLEAAVKRHMISDVPVGIFLSGGIDSSTIVAIASRVAEEPIRTFCMGFGEPTDEIEDARVIADHFDTYHRDLIIKGNLLRDYPKMIWHVDCPKRNLYTYYLSEMVSKYVKVALSGLGGDELFGGYTWKYEYAGHIEELRKKLSQSRRESIIKHARELLQFQSSEGVIDDDKHLEYLKKLRYIDSNVDLYMQIQTLDEVFDEFHLPNIYNYKLDLHKLEPVSNIYKPFFSNNESFLNQIYVADYRIKAADDFLFVEDGMSMSHSLESRVPFFDNELVEFAFTIPHEYKYRNGVGKYIFKKVAKSILPASVMKKPKRGFGTNVYLTYQWELYEFAKQKLPEGNLTREGYIRRKFIDKILTHPLQPDLIKYYCLIWNLLAFEIWYDIYINSEDISKPVLDINRFV